MPEPTATPAATDTPAPTDTLIPVAPTDTPKATAMPPTPTPAVTEAPSVEPTTSEVSGTASATVATEDVPLRVRGGPGTDYAVLGALQPGTEVALLARSADGEWYQIAYPADSEQRGWVSGEFLEIEGSPDELAMVEAPPTPTPTLAATVSPSIEPTAEVTGTAEMTATVEVTATATITKTASAVVATEDAALRVRGGPGTDYEVLGRLQPGTELVLLARSADGEWYQIAYPADSDQRGWVAGEFLEIQGAPDQLATAEAPPVPTPTPTDQAVEACAPIANVEYGTLVIASAPTDRAAESHADLNLNLRGYAPTEVPLALIDLAGGSDPAAPQLRGLFGDGREGAVTGAYQVYEWDWNADARGALIGDPEVTLLGLQASTGEVIETPDNGNRMGEQGYVAMVLYASPDRITLKYTADDNVVGGYTIHVENVCVEPTLLALYQEMNSAGRSTLPALLPGQALGRATGSEIGVVVRDKGSFMDPRSRKDWWSGP